MIFFFYCRVNILEKKNCDYCALCFIFFLHRNNFGLTQLCASAMSEENQEKNGAANDVPEIELIIKVSA